MNAATAQSIVNEAISAFDFDHDPVMFKVLLPDIGERAVIGNADIKVKVDPARVEQASGILYIVALDDGADTIFHIWCGTAPDKERMRYSDLIVRAVKGAKRKDVVNAIVYAVGKLSMPGGPRFSTYRTLDLE